MVSEYIKVRNTDFGWIKRTFSETIGNRYNARLTLDTIGRLEYIVDMSVLNQYNAIRIIISSDEKRAGLVNLTVEPAPGTQITQAINQFVWNAWNMTAGALRYSLGGKTATQKCWNCFEDRDFIENFCGNCGKE